LLGSIDLLLWMSNKLSAFFQLSKKKLHFQRIKVNLRSNNKINLKMKKILTLALLGLTVTSSKAQTIFSENFDGTSGTGLPAGWVQRNLDGLTVNSQLTNPVFGTNAWVSRPRQTGSTDRIMTSTSWYSSPAAANDWLISPPIAITSTPNNFLLFEANSPDAQYLDGFQVKVSTTDTAIASFTNTILTVPAATATFQEYAANVSSFAGQTIYIAIINKSNDKYLLNINNFVIKAIPAASAAILSTLPIAESRTSFVKVGSAGTSITGTIKNLGAAPLTSFAIKYNDGTTTYTDNKTGLNIAPFSTYNFTHATPVTFSSVGTKPTKIWIEVPNDASKLDDSSSTIFNGFNTASPYKMAIEQGTGTWCGWCPRGHVYMDSMAKTNPGAATLVAVHNGDPMTVAAYDAGLGDLIGGYPSVMVGREYEIDPSAIFTTYNERKNDFAYGNIEMSTSLNGNTLNVDAKFTPDANLSSEYRLALVIAENQVTGYTQANYYSSTSQNQNLIYEGVNWKDLPNPVPANQTHFNFVARHISDGFKGTPNSLPIPMSAGTPYTKNYTYTIPTTSQVHHTTASILVIHQASGIVCNSAQAEVALNVGAQVKSLNAVTLFPNPATEYLNVNVEANKATSGSISIINSLGQVVNQLNNLKFNEGSNNNKINVAAISAGTYKVIIKTKEGSFTSSVSIMK
jgi:hypothetical protein